jgi:putative ABC transport system ATP-binding protein
LLEARRLRRVSKNGLPLLDDAGLSLSAGECLAIVGPPGSGKTLLLRALALLDPVSLGEVCRDGVAVADVPAFRRAVMYVSQRPAFVEGTVADNLRLPFTFRGWKDRRYDEARLLEWLALLDRSRAFLDARHHELSGGESQIVALLRALQLDPAVLLLDEPMAALDEPASQTMEFLLGRWLREADRRGIVLVTHNRAQAERLAARRLLMDRGRLTPMD